MAPNEHSGSSTTSRHERRGQRLAMALALYGVWIIISAVAVKIGHTSIPAATATALLAGCAVTNLLLIWSHLREIFDRFPPGSFTEVQSLAAVGWLSVYLAVSSGPTDIVMAMYLSVLVFSIYRMAGYSFTRLCLSIAAGFAGAVAWRWGGGTIPGDVLVGHGTHYLVLVALLSWAIIYSRHLDSLRSRNRQQSRELRSAMNEAWHLASKDSLTKCYTRRHIMAVLEQEKARADRVGTQFSVCILDLDRFKSFNDEYGHLVGDEVLKRFAGRVRGTLRAIDAVSRGDSEYAFGRYGGEEFIAVLPDTGLNGANRCAERIRQAVADKVFGDFYELTVSIGVAEYNRNESVSQLLSRADEALYMAKEKGRNRVEVHGALKPEMQTFPNLRVIK